MIYLTAQTKVFLALQPVDFRKQIDGLVALCEGHLKQQPRSGGLFVFTNRAKTMVRILCYEFNGYWLATKRLSRGRYTNWPSGDDAVQALSASELNQLLRQLVATRMQIR